MQTNLETTLAKLISIPSVSNDSDACHEILDFVRSEMATSDLLKLYELTASPKTETQKYFVQHSSVQRDGVVDVFERLICATEII